MKCIILFRHGRSESGHFGPDHDRPLASSGISDVKKMGLYLSNINQLPDLVISSTALRAKTTAVTAIDEGKWPCAIEFDSNIYGGDPFFLLSLTKGQDNSYSSICIVGHEPNFSNFIAQLTGDAHKSFSKGSMAKIDFYVEKWENITTGTGRLVWIVQPKDI